VKVLLHSLDGGPSQLIDAPVPAGGRRRVVVATRASVVSAGTERMIVEFGRSSLLQKARQQPDKVRQVLDKVRTDGLAATVDAVRSKLAEPVALGYCNAGVVVDGGGSARFPVGTRVVTNGPHAEYVAVPHTLAAPIPDGVSFETAAFAPLGAIGLQGVRMAAPTLGETVVVYGLGLIGLLTVQLLRANGCRVVGIDTNDARLALARRFGAIALDARGTDVVAAVQATTEGVGADAVLMTLASPSDDPMHQAALMSRKRGRIVLVGVTGLHLRRDDFYAKELTFAVSCSYGPGRYDPTYEDEGQDYPLPFVRWTEQRNFEAVLALMGSGQLDVQPLISHRFAFDQAPDAYHVLTSGAPSLGIVLHYPETNGVPTSADRLRPVGGPRSGKGTPPSAFSVGVIGAGSFGSRVLIPAIADAGARLRVVASSKGTTAAIAARKHGFEVAATDIDGVFADAAVDTVAILTRHDSHASLVLRALHAGKHVFVEKPLALVEVDLDAIESAIAASGRILTVGFNRRFAPLTVDLRRQIAGRSGPAAVVITVNAGHVPREHWAQDPEVGGGRIVGEACHFLDLARTLVGAPIADVNVTAARGADGRPIDDISHLAVAFRDGSTAVIHYLANGSSAFPKERVEVFADGRVWRIDNWRTLESWGGGSSKGGLLSRPDKGHRDELRAFAAAVRQGTGAPIPYDELFDVSRWAIRAAREARGAS
jgi:predicted dehydrogenase/NADPH:quinone reductase-like Zn-dependent oxidoreductase